MRKKGYYRRHGGDGINDAPALAAAELALPLAPALMIAMESAGHYAECVVPLHGCSRRHRNIPATVKNIHQNLFGAFSL